MTQGAPALVEDIRSEIHKTMRDLRSMHDIVAVAVARRDGLVIAHDLPRNVDPRKVAAMSAAIVGTSEMAAQELWKGRFLQSIVDTDQGKVLSTGAGEEALLVTLVRPGANIGLILLAVARAAERIQQTLQRGGL